MAKSVFRFYNWEAGVNTTDHGDAMGGGYFGYGQNLRLEGKKIVQRPGYLKLNSTAVMSGATVHSLFRLYKDDGTTRYLIGFSGTRMLEMKATPTDWETTPTVFSTGVKMDGAVMNNTFYFGNGINGMKSTTAPGTVSAVAGAPNAAIIEGHTTANRIFSLSGKVLYWCALGNPADWSTANDAGTAAVPFSSGENGTALASMANGILLIFSYSSTHTLRGTDPGNFNRQELDTAVGTRSPQSIAFGRGGTYFLGQDNVVYWNNGTGNIPISQAVQTTLDGGSTGDYPNAVGWVEGSRYHLAYSSTGGSNNAVLVYDWKANNNRGAWVPPDYNVNVASVVVDDGLNGLPYTGDYAGFVQQQETGTTDNGTAIASFIDTKSDSYGEPERRKKTKRTYIKFAPKGSYNLTVSIAKDGGPFAQVSIISLASGGSILDSLSYSLDSLTTALDGGASEGIKRVSIVRNCRSLAHRFSISNPFELLGYSTVLSRKSVK